MLRDIDKTSTLWKNYKGFGSTHAKRETFEELYHAFKNISANSVLTYGDLLPVKKSDKYFDDVKSLDSTNNTLYYKESSFKELPLLRKVVELELTPISSNCDHAFVILDLSGNQIKNIIPFDYSDTGLYNYELKDYLGNEIPFGHCDWIVDTNSSLLTFNNGVPENVSSIHPPILSFYQYIGPVGERHYIDVVSLDIKNIGFKKGEPVRKITEEVSTKLDDIDKGFFKAHKFNGGDSSEGLGLSYNILLNAIDCSTGDPLKGFDDNSNNQVTYLLSHKIASSEIEVLFVSETVKNGKFKIQVENNFDDETGLPETNISKINVEDGFVIVRATPGLYEIDVKDSDDVYAALLVKDNKTLDLELYYPREEKDLNLKVPVFVDLMKLPPHLKLESLNSYSDHITPQYYGPRVADFIIAANDTSVNIKSSDYVVYNKEKSWFQDAVIAMEGQHLFLRSGLYENGNQLFEIPEGLLIEGEYLRNTIIQNAKFKLKDSAVKNITFKNCELSIEDDVTLENCKLENVILSVTGNNVNFLNVTAETIENSGEIQFFDSKILELKNEGKAAIFDSAVVEKIESSGDIELNNSYVKELSMDSNTFYLNSSRVDILDAKNSNENSIVNTTNIKYVKNLPEYIKVDPNYVMGFSETIRRPVYPDELTIPFYTSFKQRVYAKTPKPFWYDEKTNEIHLLLDTIENTIFINKNGELQTRFFTGEEINLTNPENIKTQIEEVYNEHADTVLDKERPKTVEEAILDIYWSKADLKNGKVPIDQLPDSVAYGGLTFVGMWSFEDSEGKYPTFTDTNEEFSSDDQYTDLQNGWFFIVSASHAEDDPVKPQYSEDGVEWTAGDWIIFSGGHNRKIDFSKPVTFLCDNYEISSEDGKVFNVFNNTPIKKVYTKNDDSGDSDSSGEESDIPHGFIGTFTLNKENVISSIDGDYVVEALGIELGQRIDEIKKFKVKSASYIQTTTKENPWEKLDRAYLDPVYSRLPEFATVTGGENPHWSIDDGGTGLLRLSYLSLAEALRLINEALLKLSPDRPCTISEVKVVLDEERTTAKHKKYIPINEGELNNYTSMDEESVWDSGSGVIYFKQEGVHDQLPLEHCFYCGTSSDINVFDGESRITDNCEIERFDPYKKYRMGFRAPTVMDGAEVTGYVKLGASGYKKDHEVKYSQYNVEKTAQVTENSKIFEGESDPFIFSERKFYKFNEYEIEYCEDKNTNLSILNREMQNNKTAGYSFITKGTELTSGFTIKNFTKFGSISKDADVEIEATFNNKPLKSLIYSKMLVLTERDREVYDLNVFFQLTLDTELPMETGTLKVKAKAKNFGIESPWVDVLRIKDLRLQNKSDIPAIVESGIVSWPTLGDDPKTNFGSDYSDKNPLVYTELMWDGEEEPGFDWPSKSKYLNRIISIEPATEEYKYDENESKGIAMPGGYYRFVTFKKSFENTLDLCGFFIDFDWVKEPSLSIDENTLVETIVQVCVTSPERPLVELMNGNKPVTTAFFEAEMVEGEACNYPGKSNETRRRITFGRKPIPIKDIYIRVGIKKDTGVKLKGLSIDSDIF